MKEIKYIIFISSSGSEIVINYGSGSDFLTSYGYGSGSTCQKVTVPTVPVLVPVPQHCHYCKVSEGGQSAWYQVGLQCFVSGRLVMPGIRGTYSAWCQVGL